MTAPAPIRTAFAAVVAFALGAGAAQGAKPAPREVSPASLGIPFEAVTFATPDHATLRGWWFPSPDSGAVLVLCPRRDGGMAALLPMVHECSQRGFSVFTFDYRDLAPGGPREADSIRSVVFASRWVDDAVAAAAEARRRAAGRRVFLWGQDLGSAVAVAAGARERGVADGVVCESLYRSCFDQLARNGTLQIPGVAERQRALLYPPDDPVSAVPRLTAPLLVFVPARDSIVPVRETNDVTRASLSVIDKERLPEAGHAGAERLPGYFERMLGFFEYVGRLAAPR